MEWQRGPLDVLANRTVGWPAIGSSRMMLTGSHLFHVARAKICRQRGVTIFRGTLVGVRWVGLAPAYNPKAKLSERPTQSKLQIQL